MQCKERCFLCVSFVGASGAEGHITMHWFRKDLRLHDNGALRAGLEGSRAFYGVYVLDVEGLRAGKVSANRWNFLLECLEDLDKSLRKIGSRLFVVRGRATQALPKLMKEWGVTQLTFEADSEAIGVQRDAVVQHMAEAAGVEVSSKTSHTLYSVEQIVEANGGRVPAVFDECVKAVSKVGMPEKPGRRVERAVFAGCVTPVGQDHDMKYGIPSVVELGLKESEVTCTKVWKGGETEALQRLEMFMQEVSPVLVVCQVLKLQYSIVCSEMSSYAMALLYCLSVQTIYHLTTCNVDRLSFKCPVLI